MATETATRRRGPMSSGGLKRPYVVPMTVNQDENEYITRKALSLDMAKTEYLRRTSLPNDWEADLAALRTQQPNLPVDEYTKAPHIRPKSRE